MTSDAEREAVILQNDVARKRFAAGYPDSYRKLRRCCICLANSCARSSVCRAELQRWTGAKWEHQRMLQEGVVERRRRLAPYLRWSRIAPLGSRGFFEYG